MPETSPLLFVLHVAGAAALLIWAVRLVRTGGERGWAVPLRRLLRQSGNNRFAAALAGTVLLLAASVWLAVVGFAATLYLAVLLERECRVIVREKVGPLPVSAWLGGGRSRSRRDPPAE